MPWLIEAYRSSHGPSYWREALTVAHGEFPDSNVIEMYTSFWDAEREQIGWRDAEYGIRVISRVGVTEEWLTEQCNLRLGEEPGIPGKPKIWRQAGE